MGAEFRSADNAIKYIFNSGMQIHNYIKSSKGTLYFYCLLLHLETFIL
jgi:hypothetical protein